jgi:uncharacterized protein (TIGR00159 family)
MQPLLEILHVQSGKDAILAVLDFALVFFVIYRILLLIKGTRAVQILVGLTVIIALFFLSKNDFWELATTHWFIDKFITNFIIIVVIIFQSDIRRALAEFGRTTFFSASARAIEETQVLEEVIKAAVMLSSRKIGALICIERSADLTHYTDEGIKVDAAVSKDLLFSLFIAEHQNPLHDGAVIIQSSRVSAAGCFLPLTNSPHVEKSLGTRHRAAIGLSEDADAAIVIVSEETGIISIAFREQLYRELDANQMRDILQSIFSTRGEVESEEIDALERFRHKEAHDSEANP